MKCESGEVYVTADSANKRSDVAFFATFGFVGLKPDRDISAVKVARKNPLYLKHKNVDHECIGLLFVLINVGIFGLGCQPAMFA